MKRVERLSEAARLLQEAVRLLQELGFNVQDLTDYTGQVVLQAEIENTQGPDRSERLQRALDYCFRTEDPQGSSQSS